MEPAPTRRDRLHTTKNDLSEKARRPHVKLSNRRLVSERGAIV